MPGRGRKTAIVLVILVVILGGLLVAADRIGLYVAESTLADQAAAEMKARSITSASPPEVDIAGFPFLTQVVAGTYDQVTIAIKAPEAGTVRLEELTVVATGVHAPLEVVTSQQGQVVADRVTGSTRMSWDSLSSLLDLAGLPGLDASTVQLTVVDNQVRLKLPVAVLGQHATIVVTGALTVAGGKVKLDVAEVGVEGDQVPPGVATQYRQKLSAEFAVPALPYALTVDKVQTTSSGIVLTASAENVVLAG